jgi:hypothetical protein
MRLTGITKVAMLAALIGAGLGCGGSSKGAEEPTGEGGGGGGTWDPAERERRGNDELVSAECLDNVSQVFQRKQRQVEQCYSRAVESGKLSRKLGGRVNIEARITPAGKATGVKISEASTLKSDEVNSCIIQMIQSWDIPKPNVAFDFTFAYQFLPWE